MMRLIDADVLKKVLDEKFQTHYGKSVYQFIHDFFRCVIRQIDKVPTIDPESLRPQGEWCKAEYKPYLYIKCSLCGHRVVFAEESNYCPNCGAKMKGADNG